MPPKRQRRSPTGPLGRGPILVPLDGSKASEGAIAYAGALARAWNAKVVLIGVTTARNQGGLAGLAPAMKLEFEQSGVQQAEDYLRRVRDRLRRTVQAEAMVRVGDPAREILAAARSTKARLLVMTTHGRSGLSRMMRGSVAGKLLQESTIPLLAIGPTALKAAPRQVRFKHVLVPLDGGKGAEAVLPVAQMLAKSFDGHISLVRVVPWATDHSYTVQMAVYSPSLDKALEGAGSEYLSRQTDSLKGVEAKGFVRRGSAETRLRDFVARQKVDLVVMSTQSRKGLARAALGSVADRMLHGKAPVLLIRPHR